jgi:hypothetical protein
MDDRLFRPEAMGLVLDNPHPRGPFGCLSRKAGEGSVSRRRIPPSPAERERAPEGSRG